MLWVRKKWGRGFRPLPYSLVVVFDLFVDVRLRVVFEDFRAVPGHLFLVALRARAREIDTAPVVLDFAVFSAAAWAIDNLVEHFDFLSEIAMMSRSANHTHGADMISTPIVSTCPSCTARTQLRA